jgi:hypothetical protein
MPIRVGPQKFEQNVDEEIAGEGEALFELLAAQVRGMNGGDQIAVVTALTGGGWKTLTPPQRELFDAVAEAFLDGGPPE